MPAARVGCSGWQYRDWRGPVYPPGLPPRRWLSRYAELFDTVEVNATFYRLARRTAVENWIDQTPPGFTFAVKASRYLTHVRRLEDLGPGLQRFLEPLEPLVAAGRLGPVLWQLPERFHADPDRLARALETLPPGRHAWEFRHASWFTEEVYALLRAHGCALVLAHHAERPLPAPAPTGPWAFVRFHFGARGRAGNYSRRELAEWAEALAAWRREREVWAYFNNDWRAFAPRNALTLRRELERRHRAAAA